MRARHAYPAWGTSRHLADRVLNTLERFLHIEAVSGGVLIVAAAAALIWANSPYADSYHALWNTTVALSIGRFSFSQSLHFIVNDGLMTIFFLVAGLEIRRELYEGTLASAKQAILPLAAAFGGVLAPAAIYLGFNYHTDLRHGWAVPIATDIAFAVGVLALLGKAIPSEVRTFLLALAIVDDIVAVIVIAIAFSHDVNVDGALLTAVAVSLVLLYHRFAVRTPIAYIVPWALMWLGLWRLGVHPTLAGVMLGLLTPVVPLLEKPASIKADNSLRGELLHDLPDRPDERELLQSLKRIEGTQRDLIPPVVVVQTSLHPWVAYLIMPLFALANAGVSFTGLSDESLASPAMAYGIAGGLLLGKPLGIFLTSVVSIRLGWCALPKAIGRRGLLLVATLGGIGFTMSIFMATLAFDSAATLALAKLAIVIASTAAAILGLVLGSLLFKRQAPKSIQFAM